MTYEETLDYLFTQLPMYQRSGPAAYKVDIQNTIKICDFLGNPQHKFKSVHIAGTNGKGSCAHMLASVLQENGYKTGLYTSPHLKDFRERVKINGEMIRPEKVVEFVAEYKEKFLDLDASFFEMTVGLAFWHFAQEEVDIAIIETGLGGRLDSTNVINPELSIITNVGLDHTQFLGDTIAKIAFEKAGIIKKGIPVVIGEMRTEAEEIMVNTAQKMGSTISYAKNLEGTLPDSDLMGPYQGSNIKTVLASVKTLNKGDWNISMESVVNGIGNVYKNTGFKGRWQVLGQDPLIVADCAHNIDGLKTVLAHIEENQFKQLHIITGMVSDKNVDIMLSLLPKNADYYFSQANISRALDSEVLKEKALEFGLKGETYSSIPKALEAARLYAEAEDMILITGSIFTVAEIL